MQIGTRIKELRTKKKMTLTELSRQSGVQMATLSRMENLKMTGTLDSHMQIARALDVDVTELYRDLSPAPEPAEHVTSQTLSDSFVFNDKASYEMLTQNVLSKKMMPTVLKIALGGQTNWEQNPKGAERFLFVMNGDIRVAIGEQSYELHQNNTLYFDASRRHQIVNIGKRDARVISVLTPVTL